MNLSLSCTTLRHAGCRPAGLCLREPGPISRWAPWQPHAPPGRSRGKSMGTETAETPWLRPTRGSASYCLNHFLSCSILSYRSKEIKPVNPKRNQPWIVIGRTDAEAPILSPSDAKSWLTGKDLDAGKAWRQEEKGTTQDEMVGWHHWLNEHEFEETLGDGERQGSLAFCSPWGHKESDTTEWLNWTELNVNRLYIQALFMLLLNQVKSSWQVSKERCKRAEQRRAYHTVKPVLRWPIGHTSWFTLPSPSVSWASRKPSSLVCLENSYSAFKTYLKPHLLLTALITPLPCYLKHCTHLPYCFSILHLPPYVVILVY